MSRIRCPGGALLHPLALASLVALVVNDHVLKRVCPGVVTGKLSDFAGVLLLPLLLHAVFEVSHARIAGRAANVRVADRVLLACAVLTTLAFALPELWSPAEAVYRVGLGALQWPFAAAMDCLRGGELPPLRRVRATADATDLLALPMALVAYRLARRSRPRPLAPKPVVAVIAGWLSVAAFPSFASAAENTHDGWYLGFELGPTLVFVDSTASISNGFQQPISSTARGASAGGGFELGGTIPNAGLMLGGRLGFTRVYSPVVETLGERFRLDDHSLGIWSLELIAEFYPNPRSGLHVGAGIGLSGTDPDISSTRSSGHAQHGYAASLEFGHGLWIGKQWTLGGTVRLTAARLTGEDFGRTTLWMPGVYAAAAFH